MTSDVVTLGRESSVAAAMQAMLTHGITGIPVVEERRVVGIVTARDLLGQALYRLVGDVMTGEVATIAPEASITDAYHLMETRDVARLPVVEDGELVGLVSRPDILRELGKLTDPLTGLPWPGTLRHHAATLLAAGREITVLFIDLDRFRQVNKRFGHVAGDRLIIDAARVLSRLVDPAKDLLCRYGGDEFAIVATRSLTEAEAFAETILTGLQGLRVPEPDGFVLGASIGLAGGRRLEEREAHPEATVDDLITLASRASTAAKTLERSILQAHQMEAMEALTQALPEEEMRLRLAGVRLTVEGERSSAAVELEHEGRRYTGTAEGSSIGHSPVRVLAEAAVSAVAQLLPPGWGAEVEEIAYTSFPLGDAVSVALALATPAGEELLMGTVPYAHTDASAVVRATLKAANRRLGRLLVLTHA
jgi:diguanylate cyclase (GGDEF)-like protein